MGRDTRKQTMRGGGLVLAFAALLGLLGLFTGSAGAQTSGGATATDGSVASGNADASGGSTASGGAEASNGSVASGCSTASNNSTASGGDCVLTVTTLGVTTTTVGGSTVTTTGGTTATTVVLATAGGSTTGGATAGRLAVTGSSSNRLVQGALGLLFVGLLLIALGLEGPAGSSRRFGKTEA